MSEKNKKQDPSKIYFGYDAYGNKGPFTEEQRKKAQREMIAAFGLAGTGLTLGTIPAAKFLERVDRRDRAILKGKDPKGKGVLKRGSVRYLSGRGGGGNIASQFGMGKRGAEKMRKSPFELNKGGVVKMRGGGIIARDRLKPTKIT
tara:strand:- start:43 stop:480 length:438 start_codon:yes stop_codon:yes gene_type:complete